MAHFSEIKTAKAAKAAIEALSTATRSAALATLRTANHVAVVNLSSGGALNEARASSAFFWFESYQAASVSL
jgi:hypothetical protein